MIKPKFNTPWSEDPDDSDDSDDEVYESEEVTNKLCKYISSFMHILLFTNRYLQGK